MISAARVIMKRACIMDIQDAIIIVIVIAGIA
jgi:hypothetical protein